MGCDIHLYVEKKENGSWVSADKWSAEIHESGRQVIDYDDRFYTGRNYNLFAILANVRNGVGFAGIDTGDGFIPISEPRGLPNDVCALVKRESDSWDCDGHSHSWFTVAELLNYDWNQKTKHRGWVNINGFKAYQKDGKPNEWCGKVSGPSIKHISNEQMLKAVEMQEAGLSQPANYLYTLVEWEESYADSVKKFLNDVLPELKKLGNPDEVRIVFWFDN